MTNPAIKRISPAEMQLRREKGMCYFCDDKFSFSHKCPNKHLMLLELSDDPENLNSPTSVDIHNTAESEEMTEHHLSFNAFHGATGMGVIRFKGYIGPICVSILLDGGSSDSFIQPRIVKCLNLDVEPTNGCKVLVGNGQNMKTEGVVKKLSLKIQGIEITVPAYLLPIAGADVILGARWLASLGPHVADYATPMLKFYLDGKFVTLQGEVGNKPVVAQLNLFKRLNQMNAISELFTIQKIGPVVLEDNWNGRTVDLDPEMSTRLHTYREIFQIPKGLPPTRGLSHEIVLKEGAQPVKVRPYRYPHSQKQQIEKMVQDMLEDGIIQPSLSPFSSPNILVKKKDGTWRCCTDYRALNAITIKDSFPMPTVDELLDELHGANFFSKLDLRSGYHQILLKQEDRQKTTFRTHQGHYEWLVMPFGLTNAPATFQRLMNQLFQPLLRKCVLVFFDDILVYSPSWQSHLQHVETVFQILSQNVLYAKLSKCSFGLSEVEYLGHIVSGAGVSMDRTKVQAVLDWHTPTNLKQLRGFLGLTGYYRRFIKSYAIIAGPLTNLLKKDAFKWDENTQTAFEQLKRAITSAPVLVLPDFSQVFILETDASGTGVGAVLSQGGHPIAFFSKNMAPRMQLQSAYTREFYAITAALAKFRHYLLGHKFILRTDQKSLKSLLDQSLQTPEQQAWLHKFIGFDFQIEYKPGKDNLAADALSRMMSLSLSSPECEFLDALKKAIMEDAHLKLIVQQCLHDNVNHGNYSVKDGFLYWKHRLVVPAESCLIQTILKEYHDTPIGGHAGVTRTLARVASQFYWPNMRQHVQKFIEACIICQQAKSVNTPYAGLLHPLPIPEQVWEDISMDFITGLPPSSGFTVIMVVVDRLSKYAHFMPMKSDYSSKTVAETFMHNVVKLHGMPKSIVSDRDKIFTSKFWQHLFQLQGTTLAMSSAYHPQTDGQSEAVNKCLEMYLRCFSFKNPKDWSRALTWAELWYNTAWHSSLGMSPFKALYGREPPMLTRYNVSNADPMELQQQLIERDRILLQLKENLGRAQQVMKHNADKKRKDVSLEIGDQVLVKLQPYRQSSVALRKNNKLGMRYFGPFNIIDKIGAVAYKLQLPETARIHPVFHVSQLKVFKGLTAVPYLPLPLTTVEEGPVIQPAAVLNTRRILRGTQVVEQVLVKWKDMPSHEATWEDREEMLQTYPNLNLEDKIVLDGEGNVMGEKGPIEENNVNEEGNADVAKKNEVRRSNRIKGKHPRWTQFVMNSGNKKREIVLGCVSKLVYSRRRNKKEPIKDVIQIDSQVDFANQEGEIDSRHGDAIGSVVDSIFPFNSKIIPRRARTKCKRKFKGSKALSRSKEKLDSQVFENYLAKIWKSFSEDRKMSFAYLDSLWFSLYRNPSSKDKVLSWINKERIFTKAYVFVPIVCWGHWNLLIFCHFGENLGSVAESRCMLLLDSLEMANPRRLEPEIRRFVQDIYKAGDRPETKHLISKIPLLVPKVPQQKDGTECGNFVLYFIKLFLELAPDHFSMDGYPYFMKKDWFTFEELDRFCESLTH